MKKNTAKQNRFLFSAFIVLALVLPLVAVANSYGSQKARGSNVLGEENSTETKEEPEKIEAPEPTETPEPQEQEAEKIHKEVEQKVEQGKLESIEVSPRKENQQTGTLKLEQANGQTTERQISASQSPVATLQSVQLGDVSLSVNANGTVGLVNAGVRIETNYPVIIDPQTKTVSIRTKTGLTVINMFPSQILPQLPLTNKPTITQSVQLTSENNQPAYLISGRQTRRFMGMFPVEASIRTSVSANDGSVLSVDEPWYFKNLAFLYSI